MGDNPLFLCIEAGFLLFDGSPERDKYRSLAPR